MQQNYQITSILLALLLHLPFHCTISTSIAFMVHIAITFTFLLQPWLLDQINCILDNLLYYTFRWYIYRSGRLSLLLILFVTLSGRLTIAAKILDQQRYQTISTSITFTGHYRLYRSLLIRIQTTIVLVIIFSRYWLKPFIR